MQTIVKIYLQYLHNVSPAPKANEDLDEAKFYTKNGKSENRPGFGCQSGCDCYTLCTLAANINCGIQFHNFCINIGNAFSLYRMLFRHIAHKRMWWYKYHFKKNRFFWSAAEKKSVWIVLLCLCLLNYVY